jgi:outer membrane lipoprotein-sorting protein
MAAALLTCSAASAAAADALSLQQLSRRLSARGDKIQTLRAKFVQRKKLALFKTDVETKGRILYRRPDRLRWETFAPDRSLLIVRGDRAELRVPGERPRVINLNRSRTLGLLVEQMLVWLGARPATKLREGYDVAIEQQDQTTLLRLRPKDEALKKRIEAIRVWLGPELQIQKIQVQQSGRDQTVIDITEIEQNIKLRSDAFQAGSGAVPDKP